MQRIGHVMLNGVISHFRVRSKFGQNLVRSRFGSFGSVKHLVKIWSFGSVRFGSVKIRFGQDSVRFAGASLGGSGGA